MSDLHGRAVRRSPGRRHPARAAGLVAVLTCVLTAAGALAAPAVLAAPAPGGEHGPAGAPPAAVGGRPAAGPARPAPIQHRPVTSAQRARSTDAGGQEGGPSWPPLASGVTNPAAGAGPADAADPTPAADVTIPDSAAAAAGDVVAPPRAPVPAGPIGVRGREFTRGGERFFWLGDTAWSLFLRLDRDEALRYLDTRARQGFTVIQAVAIFPQGGPGPNAYGDSPFRSGLGELAVTEGSDPTDAGQYDFWDHVDFVVHAAAERGLVVGILPLWADKQVGHLLTSGNAEAYGQFLGRRYRAADNVVWIMGGDAPAAGVEDVWRRLADGITAGGGTQPVTYHPRGDQSSVEWFTNDDRLAFHMIQGGHCLRYDVRDRLLRTTYAAGKPFLDGEPIYEDHPYCWKPASGFSTALDVRRDAWWAVAAGAAGHTYGHHAIWQFLSAGGHPLLGARGSWTTALEFPAAEQMRHLRTVVESLPRLEPADDLLTDPGKGESRIAAAVDAAGATLLAYTAAGRPITLNPSRLRGPAPRVSWLDPRTGTSVPSAWPGGGPTATFTPPPTPGAGSDWVLLLDARPLPSPATPGGGGEDRSPQQPISRAAR